MRPSGAVAPAGPGRRNPSRPPSRARPAPRSATPPRRRATAGSEAARRSSPARLRDLAEQPVDEAAGIVGRERLGQLDGLVDRNRYGHVVGPEELEQRDPNDVAIEDRKSVV